jgi:aminobenzoyl-glutamate utilization protein B
MRYAEMEEMWKNASNWADENKDQFFEAAQEIWQRPELSMQERHSSGVLKGLLEAQGFKVESGVGGMPTAFIAEYGTGAPTIGFSCEYDALPGLSQQMGVAYKSPIIEGAPGHGCGHNLLGAGAAFAASITKSLIEKFSLSATVRVIGAPAEELCLGKPFLGKAGLLSGFDAILDWHPSWRNTSCHADCPAYFSVKFKFKGRAAHGNAPWEGRSAMDAAMLCAQGTEYLREHIYPGDPPYAASTFNYTFSDTGPEFPSVVPDHAAIWLVGRFKTSDAAVEAMRRISNCAKGAALMTETEVEAEVISATNEMIPNTVLSECMHRNFTKLGPPEFTREEHEEAKALQKAAGVSQTGLPTGIMPLSGGFTPVADITEYSWNAPFATAGVVMAPDNVGWHNWCVTLLSGGEIGRKCMDKAARLLSATALELIIDPGIISRAKEEFKNRLAGRSYKSLLPEEALPPVEMNKEAGAKYKPARFDKSPAFSGRLN